MDLDIKKLRGQGYDGASYMSGRFQGVKARIQQVQPLAIYTHCVAHVLNLVVVSLVVIHSCSNHFIRDTLAVVKEVINFFKESVQSEHVSESKAEFISTSVYSQKSENKSGRSSKCILKRKT
jgi:hypothetical protein